MMAAGRNDAVGAFAGEEFLIVSGSYDRTRPRVAYGNGMYLVAWEHYVDGW